MTTLEKLIRPAQTGDIRPTYFAVPRGTVKNPDENTITWGGSGDNVFQLRAHVKQDVKNDLKGDETQRKYDTLEISNPDDPDQKIEVEALTEYQARNRIDKSRIILRYSEQQPAANIKVLKRGQIRKTGNDQP